jgi:hypothetical protein
MKLKITQREVTEKETDIDLPIYLYSQDEDCMDEYIKWDGKVQTTIKYGWFGYTVERSSLPLYVEEYQLSNLCTQNQFEESFKEVMEYLSS